MTLEEMFPQLSAGEYRITSPADQAYNCIAWAADVADRWWWPDPFQLNYWPSSVPREETLEAFMAAFQQLGYQQCEHGDLEPGFEKIAIYAKQRPTHAARQLPSGQWTSKLGQSCDIEHARMEGVAGAAYGSAVPYLKRTIK